MNRRYESLNINFGSNFGFPARIKLVSTIMSSSALRTTLRDKLVPLYCIYQGKRIVIGYITELEGKVTARCRGENKVYLFADVYITSNEPYILDACERCLGPHKKKYKLMFVSSDMVEKPTEMIKGMIIKFDV